MDGKISAPSTESEYPNLSNSKPTEPSPFFHSPKRPILYTFLVLIIGLLIGIGFARNAPNWFHLGIATVMPTISPIPSISPLTPQYTASPSTDMTDWKTYINNKWQFQFSYPSSWDVNGDPSSQEIAIFNHETNKPSYSIEITMWKISEGINSFEEEARFKGEENASNCADLPNSSICAPNYPKQVTKKSTANIPLMYSVVKASNKQMTLIPIPNNDQWYVLIDTYTQTVIPNNIYDQILSTFKFLDQVPAPTVNPKPITIPGDWKEYKATDYQAKLTVTVSLPPNYSFDFTGSEWNLGNSVDENWDYASSILFDNNGNPRNTYDGSSRRAWYQRYLNKENGQSIPPVNLGEIVSVIEHTIGPSSYLEVKVVNGSQQTETHYLYVEKGIVHILTPLSGKALTSDSVIAKNLDIIFTSLKSSFEK